MKSYVTINFASSLDGKIALKGGKSFKFSNYEDLVRVHELRSKSDVILVGKNTVNLDDPKLVVNEKYFKSDHIPDVAILDTTLAVNPKARVFNYPRKVILLCGKDARKGPVLAEGEAETVIRRSTLIRPNSSYAVKELGSMGYSRIMVEGGKSVISSFISEGNWDEISIFYSPIMVGEEGISMFGPLSNPLTLGSAEVLKLGDGVLVRIKKGF